MALSRMSITFNFVPFVDTELTIVDSLNGISMTEVFKASRTSIGEVERSTLEQTVVNYASNLGTDYNNTSLYLITYSTTLNIVKITALNPNSQFSVTSNTTSGGITTEIFNETPETVFTLDSVAISEASINPCDNVKLTITTNEQADTISSPISQVVSANPLVIDVPRQGQILVSMVKDGIIASKTNAIPKLLSSYFSIDVVNTPSSASITVNNTFLYTPLFTLEYSLNNVDWSSSNHFNNLPIGSYTVYIRDNIGCSISMPFTIDSFTPNLVDYDGVAEISNLNPIRYKEVVTWSDTVPKTPYNTLSFEEDIRLNNCSFLQPFAKIDTPRTQIKTNYETVSAKIIDNNDNETALTMFKMTSNMNVTDVRDGVVLGTTYNGLNYVSVKFSGGNTYDPITLADNGDYSLGTAVPSWMNAGDYVNIQGAGWYKVLEIVYNTDADVIVLNLLVNDFPLTLGTFKITSVYNAVDYERYEFELNLTSLEGYYKVQIDLVDSTFDNKTYLSEWLDVRDSNKNIPLIKYYNTENNEINFNTGFIGQIRIPLIDDLKWKSNTEQEIYITDTNTVNLESKYRGFWDFSSKLLPTMMAEKLTMVLLQDRLFIDTVNYLTEESIESVNVGGQYQIKANLVRSNYAFNNISGLGVGEVVLQGTPLKISESGGFLLVE